MSYPSLPTNRPNMYSDEKLKSPLLHKSIIWKQFIYYNVVMFVTGAANNKFPYVRWFFKRKGPEAGKVWNLNGLDARKMHFPDKKQLLTKE